MTSTESQDFTKIDSTTECRVEKLNWVRDLTDFHAPSDANTDTERQTYM